MRTNVYFGVDTETSMGAAWREPERRPLDVAKTIFCRAATGDCGVPTFAALLQERGLRATFFVEMFCSYPLGVGALRTVTDFLLERGQDVQLHVHPTFRHYGRARAEGVAFGSAEWLRRAALPDDVCGYREDEQVEILGDAARIFRELTGAAPVAFRAGRYGGDRSTLAALERVGIYVDSSFNPCAAQSFAGATPAANQVSLIGGVREFPITVMRNRMPGLPALRPFEVAAVSFREMRLALEHAHNSGLRQVSVVAHSFGLAKRRDVYFNGVKSDWIVRRRFARLLDYLAAHSDRFRVSTFQEAAAEALPAETPVAEPMVTIPPLRSLSRLLVQGANRMYWL